MRITPKLTLSWTPGRMPYLRGAIWFHFNRFLAGVINLFKFRIG